jgi:glucose/arabinose dehydrogenase
MSRWYACAVAALLLPLAACTEAPATTPDAGNAPAAPAPAAAAAPAAAPAAKQTFGKGVSAADRTPIADLLAKPDSFVDQVVRVEGIATKVCEHRGCWVEIAQDGTSMRVKVDDGVIVFPREIMGSRVAAEGVFTKKVVKHHPEPAHEGDCAEHQHPETVEKAVYQIQGTGAVVL